MRRVSVVAVILAGRRLVFRESYHCSTWPMSLDPLGPLEPAASPGFSTLWESPLQRRNVMAGGWHPRSPMGLEGSGWRFSTTENGSKAGVTVAGKPGCFESSWGGRIGMPPGRWTAPGVPLKGT